MSLQCVRVERDGELALVVAQSPPVNTITAEVRAGLREALDEIRSAGDIRAVVLMCEGLGRREPALEAMGVVAQKIVNDHVSYSRAAELGPV